MPKIPHVTLEKDTPMLNRSLKILGIVLVAAVMAGCRAGLGNFFDIY